ncbi:DUF1489 family protein [Kordiimonas sp. SCSIO 12610]|uniref:DUF1489 family protein n=1 Tax=Kordiimonas sp. SCSIO 12610 TaxID=2829597 RepID=UPI00210E6C81|nr:DUF1489 domain-containing protein [Kordiimonas sp. SCSIO 12610]UTW54279.1 DUF1489 domain-containing protein [Kordiimonas sp. SCSIO 12610]
MTLHLLRVAAGVKSIDHLREVVERFSYEHTTYGTVMPLTTRNRPKRQDELLKGGSVYWIVKNVILARAPLVGFEEFQAGDGRTAVNMLVKPEVILTEPRPKRGFQGWRYLKGEDAPDDLTGAGGKQSYEDMPTEMMIELKELGLL